MRLIDKYLVFTSVFALFTEAFTFHYIIDLKLYYIILITNFLILSTIKKTTIHKNLLFVIAFLLVHGFISFLIINNPIRSLIAQVIGIAMSSIFYHNLFNHYGVKKLFKKYLSLSFYISIISAITFFLQINSFDSNRLNGIMLEPAHYAIIMLPAIYYFLRNKDFFKLSTVLITVLLTKSFIAYVGLIFIFIFPLIKLKFFIRYSWVAIIVLCSCVFYLKSKWNDPTGENKNIIVRKVKQTSNSFNTIFTGKFENYTNLTSYAIISNAFITKEIFFDKPLGAGLGSYKHEYDKYYENLTPPKYLIKQNLSKINKTDANSLFLRMLADLGLFALIIFGYFFYRSIYLFQRDNKIRQQSTFFYLILKVIREGHYFPPEFYFFLLIFLKNNDENITHN